MTPDRTDARPPLPAVLPAPPQLREYARAHGWEKEREWRGRTLFVRHDDPLAQLAIPLDAKADGYRRAVEDVAVTLAEFRGLSPRRVLVEAATVGEDVLRYTLADSATRDGGVPLDRAEELLAGIRTSLLAAAHSVVNPAAHHARLSRADPVRFVRECRLARTSRGSFAASITCPLDAVEGPQTLLPGTETFARRTTALLMRALGVLRTAFDEDAPEKIADDPAGPVSSNLCAALVAMRPAAGGRVTVEPFWAGTVPPPPNVPGRVRFDDREFATIERVRERLRPQREPEGRRFYAFVSELRGEPGDDGPIEGAVTLRIVRESGGELIARGELPADQYRRAAEAHLSERLVVIRAILEPHARVSRLRDLVLLDVLDASPGPAATN